MFERETRREKILEAIDLNREIQLRQKSKKGLMNLVNAGKKQKHSILDKTEAEEEEEEDEKKVAVTDPITVAETEFYRIINEVVLSVTPKYVQYFAF